MKTILKNKNLNNKKFTLINLARPPKGFDYNQYKTNRQKSFDDLPIYWAFGEQQFKELLQKLNLKDTKEDLDKLISLPFGGIMRKCDLFLLKNHNETFSTSNLLFWLSHNFQFAYSAFKYEMINHEFYYTYEIDDTLDALGINLENIKNNAMLRLAFLRAKKDYLKHCNSCNY